MAADVEAALSELLAAGAHDQVATRALEAYGDEVHGFLVHHLGSERDAAEAFGQMSEDLWKGLPAFGARCSVRTWMYVLARHAASRFRHRSGDGEVAQQRTRTWPLQPADVKDPVAALRDELDPDDRALLALRVDRAMPWQDIARVTLDADDPDATTLEREIDRLIERFQLVKDQLHRRAREIGILDEGS